MLGLSQDMLMLGIPAASLAASGVAIAWAALEVRASKKFAAACQHNAQVDRHAIEEALKRFNQATAKLTSEVEDVKSTTKIHSKSISGSSVGSIKLGERVDHLENRAVKLTSDVEVIFSRLEAFGLNETAARLTRLENAVNSSFRDLTNDIGQIRTWLGGMNTRQNEFEARFKDGADSSETIKLALSELNNRICKMNGDISGELDALRADVSMHGNEVARLHDMIAEIEKGDKAVLSLAASLRHQELMLDGLDRRTEGLRQAISVTAEQIESLRRQLDVPSLEESFETRVNIAFGEVNDKVNEIDGALSTLTASLGSRVHAIETKVTTLDDIAARIVPGCEKRIEEIRADLQGQLDSVAADIVELRS